MKIIDVDLSASFGGMNGDRVKLDDGNWYRLPNNWDFVPNCLFETWYNFLARYNLDTDKAEELGYASNVKEFERELGLIGDTPDGKMDALFDEWFSILDKVLDDTDLQIAGCTTLMVV